MITRGDDRHPGRVAAPKEGVLERAGSKIHYWTAGPDDAPLVAFTPGATMDHRMFDAQVGPVLGAGYRVLTWDPRGHGLSKPIGLDLTVRSAAEDLLALLDIVGADRAALVGQSFGGNVAQELVFSHPERVGALVVIGCTCNTLMPSRMGLLALELSPLVFRLWPYGDLKKRVANAVSEKPEVREYARDAVGLVSRKEFLTIWRAVADALHDEPGYRIDHPLLITHGERDRLGNIAAIAPAWTARDPNSRRVEIPAAGHNANQDNPAFFNQLLLDFLTDHRPVSSSSRSL